MPRLAVVLTVWGLTLVSVSSATPYLPAIGPAPLRFALPRLPAAAVLPPLVIDSLAPATATAESSPVKPVPSAETAAAPAESAGSASSAAPIPAPTTGSPGHPPMSAEQNGTPFISPETLAHVYTQRVGTNQVTAVDLPIRFNPAPPPAAASSSAVYSSPSKP